MNKRMNSIVLVALVLLPAMFTVSCALPESGDKATEQDKLRAEIRAVVPDASRRDSMLETVERMATHMRELRELRERHRDQLAVSVRSYKTTREQLEEQLARHLNERRVVVEKLADAHYDFKSLATEQEWKKLAGKEKKALSSIVKEPLGGGES